MNKNVLIHMLQTYGRRPGVWIGLVAEIVRTLMQRVWVAILVAQMAANLASGDLEAAKYNALWFFAVYVIGALIGAAGELIAVDAEDREYERLLMAYYTKLTSKDMSFYRDHQTGYLVSLFRQYLDSMMQLVRLSRGEVTRMIISLIAPVVVLFVADIRLGLAILGVVVIQMFYIFWASSKANYWRERSHEIYREVTGKVSDIITNIVAFRSGGLETPTRNKLEKLVHEETETFWQRRKIVTLLDIPRELATAIGVTIAFFIVLSGTSNGATSVGLILLTLTYLFQVIRSVSELPNLITIYDDFATKLYPTLRYLATDHETIRDAPNPKKLVIESGSITIKNVGFTYAAHSSKKNTSSVFQDLNITIHGGERIGIVGLSGAGKSTLVSLLMRFDDVTQGEISIDGTTIRDVKQNELHQKIAYVPQEPLLFHSTISENIAYFNSKATKKQIIAASKAAHAHEFIQKLPDGYNTVVGERGIKLSGGQKQRIVIARAILKNAPIMIFDEATSALDTESEKIIQQSLPSIIGKHTAIIIAHRLSTVANLDRILVMHNGQIIEAGTHKELLALKGRYYSLWQKQTSTH